MGDINDSSPAGRADRARAREVVGAALASGRISGPDVELRLVQIDAAATRGDLAMVVRDLEAHAPGPAAPPPPVGPPMPPQQPVEAATPAPQQPVGSAPSGRRPVRVGRVVVIVALAFIATCGLSLLGFAWSLFSGLNGVDTSSSPAPQTAEGWTAFVAAVEDESGSTEVYDAVVYPTYASANMPVKGGATRRFWGGEWGEGGQVTDVATVFEPLDLTELDPDVVASLPARTRDALGATGTEDSTYVVINAVQGEPVLTTYVTVPGQGSRWVRYGPDGTVLD